MAEDLAEIHERLSIAEADTARFRQQVRAFFDSATELKMQGSPERVPLRTVSLVARSTKPPPTDLRVRLGQVVNEIRSCLDALACQLARRNGDANAEASFPIAPSQETFLSRSKKELATLAALDRARIEAFQPYAEGNADLYRLHRVDIQRKHVKLCPAATVSGLDLGAVRVGPGSRLNMFDVTINGHDVHEMAIDGAAGRELRQVGEFVEIATGVPIGLAQRARLLPSLVYDEPPEAAGMDVINVLEQSLAATRAVVAAFD